MQPMEVIVKGWPDRQVAEAEPIESFMLKVWWFWDPDVSVTYREGLMKMGTDKISASYESRKENK